MRLFVWFSNTVTYCILFCNSQQNNKDDGGRRYHMISWYCKLLWSLIYDTGLLHLWPYCVFCTWASSEIYQSRYIPSDNSFYKKNVDCNYNNVLTTFLTNELFFVLRLYSRLYYNVPWKKKEVFAFPFFSDVVKFFPFLPLFRRKFLLLPSQS